MLFTHVGGMDLKVVVIIKREIIYGENHANEVTKKMLTSIIPSLCWILVYNDETSSVTIKELAGKLPMVRSLLRKSLVSLTRDGSL